MKWHGGNISRNNVLYLNYCSHVKLQDVHTIDLFTYDLNEIQDTKRLHITHLNVRNMVNKWDDIKTNLLDSGIHDLFYSDSWLHALLPDSQFYRGKHYTLLPMIENEMIKMTVLYHLKRWRYLYVH